MPTNLRRLGVYGESLPTKKSKVVRAADFNIGGIIGLFQRRYKIPMECNNFAEFQQKFGDHVTSTYYGYDAVQGFFNNAVGVDAKLWIVGHVGYDGAAYDGVAATATLVDALAASTLKLESAYEETLDYSTYGNKTGYTITNGTRFTTAIKTATTKDNTWIIVDSVSDIKVGDIIKVVATAGGGATVYKEVTAIDESTGRVDFSGAFDAAANPDVDDVVTIPGFQLQLYRKSATGVESKVEEDLGKIWCTMQDTVTDYFIENVFSSSKYVKATDLDSASAIGSTFPADVATVTYMASGVVGTVPSTAAHWSQDLLAFDNKPIRFIANPETTTESIQKAIETYCRTRWDLPKVIYNVAEDQTKAQYITIGNNFQRSDDVLGVIVADWLKITDPFATSSLSPDRSIPNVGHVMGAWVRAIATVGAHYIPSIKSIPLYGLNGITRDVSDPSYDWDDNDRTDLAEAGVNIITFVQGSGYIIRNFFTPSTSTEFQFGNGILMREYIKVSSVDSLQSSENTPNSLNRIKEDKMAILNFMLRLWRVGSTGNSPEGEFFGQSEDAQGNPTKWSDHIQVQADAINNPQSSINAGERNIDVWFTFPAPAGSIKIGCGLLLLS